MKYQGTSTMAGRLSLLFSRGFSLLELMIVVTILSIAAAITIPNIASTDPVKLDIAAKEIATAIRFAQAESVRTKTAYGINTDATNDRIRVYRLPSLFPVYDVYHPVNKKLYDIQLKTHPFAAGVDLVSANFAFDGSFSSSSYLGFNTDGYPKYKDLLSTTEYMLISGVITLRYAGQTRTVNISPMTGRVTIQ